MTGKLESMKELLLSWGMLITSVLFNALGVFIIKLKLNEYGAIQMDSFKTVVNYFLLLVKSPFVVFGLVIFFLSPFLFTIALSRMEIAVAYPVQIGLNFLFLLILAVVVLGEQLTLFKILGICFIMIGIVILNKAAI